LPLVANYSGFYRMPLGNPESVADTIAANPGSFGYSEATRKFELPPASGTTEINIFASRSTIDTGVTISSPTRLFSSINRTIDQQSDHQDLTVNQDLGFRLSRPGPEFEGFHSTLSGGVDYKTYQISSFTTNKFIFTEHLFDSSGNPFTRVSVTPCPGYRALSLVSAAHVALGCQSAGQTRLHEFWAQLQSQPLVFRRQEQSSGNRRFLPGQR
jgi:hypothetical protein